MEKQSITEEKNYQKYSHYFKITLIAYVIIVIILSFIIFPLNLGSVLKNLLIGSILFIWVLIYLFYSAYCGIRYNILPNIIFRKAGILGKAAYRTGIILLILGILLLGGYLYFITKLFIS